MKENLRILMVEPHKAPYEASVPHELSAMQQTVGGLIEVVRNGDGTLLVCNEEGKLLGLRGFTRYGLSTTQGELLLFQVAPTNISVLSQANIAIKIRHLMMVLSTLPDLEITCTDASECFDGNKAYLAGRLAIETNQKVRRLIQKDIAALDELQAEMSTARQFLFTARCKNLKPEQVFQKANTVEKRISEQGFEVHRMKKPEIKRFLALYFEASQYGEALPDVDGAQYFEVTDDEAE